MLIAWPTFWTVSAFPAAPPSGYAPRSLLNFEHDRSRPAACYNEC